MITCLFWYVFIYIIIVINIIQICLNCEGTGGDFCFASTDLKVTLTLGDGIYKQKYIIIINFFYLAVLMDTDVLTHENLDFSPDKIIQEEDDQYVMTDGVKTVAIYVIHKNVLNAVEQMCSLNEK